jgi:hypothetical protein
VPLQVCAAKIAGHGEYYRGELFYDRPHLTHTLLFHILQMPENNPTHRHTRRSRNRPKMAIQPKRASWRVNRNQKGNTNGAHTNPISDCKQVHDKYTLIMYLRFLCKSKREDDKKHKCTSLVIDSGEWANHTIHEFLEAMLSGSGFEPDFVADADVRMNLNKKNHPKNPWAFVAYLFSLGQMYE